MIRHLPKMSYSGLTVILSNPSRHDHKSQQLLSLNGGSFFDRHCLQPAGLNRYACDIRTADNDADLLPNTKAILLLGEESMHKWTTGNQHNTLGELRGSPLNSRRCVSISSYLPQDCVDVSDWEGKLNPLLADADDSDSDSDGSSALGEKRRHGKTSRKNWAFWLKKDCERISKLLDNDGCIPSEPTPTYRIYPPSEEIIHLLTTRKNELFFFDCETDANLNFTCFSFSFGLPYVYVVPVQRHNYTWAYSRLPHIFKALAVAIRDNTTVAHNGSSFDYFVLAHKYKIGISRRVADTMIMMHRCFPEVEKSLGHCTSLWTWQPFHKDEGNFAYGSESQAQQLWAYCGKDVYTMILIYENIMCYVKRKPGLLESIAQAHASIRPYLITTLQGIRYDESIRASIVSENDRLCNQYIRMTEHLIGKDTARVLRRKSKKPMCNSNTQCTAYFHDMLGYPVVGKSKKTGKPSLAKKNLFKLKLKIENPVIDVAIAYRETLKETGSLKFVPWKE